MAAVTTTPVTPVTPVAPVALAPNAPVPVGTTDEILLTACERCGHMAEYRQRATCEAARPDRDVPPGKMPPPFPPTTVDDGIATISFRVPGNGHVHNFKVPEDALSFLQDLWSRTPFRVSSGGKAKKLILSDGTPVHILWFVSRGVDMRDRKPKCRNHDWLDWTNDNVYVPTMTRTGKTVEESQQARFDYMSRAGQIDNSPPKLGMQDSPLDLIDARVHGPEIARRNAATYVDPVFAATQVNERGEDESVVWAFEDAATMPARRCHPSPSLSAIEGDADDERFIALPTRARPTVRRDYHKPAGWEPGSKKDADDRDY